MGNRHAQAHVKRVTHIRNFHTEIGTVYTSARARRTDAYVANESPQKGCEPALSSVWMQR